MNLLPFIFAVLFILSYSSASLIQKYLPFYQTQKHYKGSRKAERSILLQVERKDFAALPGVSLKRSASNPRKEAKPEGPASVIKLPKVNPDCARLNLFLLVQEGKAKQATLYETTAKLLRTFYQKELLKTGDEYRLLDAMLAAAKKRKEKEVALETLKLEDPSLQNLYYFALKGTKRVNLGVKGYPALIDYCKIASERTPICLIHAHPHILAPFFGMKQALFLYQKIHQEKKKGLSIEAVLKLTDNPELAFVSPEVWDLIDFHPSSHKEGEKKEETLIAEDQESGISLRRKVSS